MSQASSLYGNAATGQIIYLRNAKYLFRPTMQSNYVEALEKLIQKAERGNNISEQCIGMAFFQQQRPDIYEFCMTLIGMGVCVLYIPIPWPFLLFFCKEKSRRSKMLRSADTTHVPPINVYWAIKKSGSTFLQESCSDNHIDEQQS